MSEHSPKSTVTLINLRGLYDPSANGYSHVAAVEAGARLVFIAGQGGGMNGARLNRVSSRKYAKH